MLQQHKKQRFSSEKGLIQLTSNKFESDISLSRHIRFQHFVKAKLLSSESNETKEIYYQFGYKLKDNAIKYTTTLKRAKEYFTEPKEEVIEPIYQPLNHNFLFNTIVDYSTLLERTLNQLNDNYLSSNELNSTINTNLNIRNSKNILKFQKIHILNLNGSLTEQEEIRQEIDQNICKGIGEKILDYGLDEVIPLYITILFRYLTLKKLKFKKNVSKLFSNREFLILDRDDMKSYLYHVFDILISTSELISKVDNLINYDFKLSRIELTESLNNISDLKFIPLRWKSHICRFLNSIERSWISLKSNFSHLFIFCKNTLLGLSLINNNMNMRDIILSLPIPSIYKETSIKVLTKEYPRNSSYDFSDFYESTLQSLKMKEFGSENREIDVNGLSCILKDYIRCDIHYSRLSLYSNGYLCILVSKLLHLQYIDSVKEIILNDYLFLIQNNIMLYNQYQIKSLEFNNYDQLITKYTKISLIEILFQHYNQEVTNEFQNKLEILLKQLLNTIDIHLNILISCLFTLKTPSLTIMKRKSIISSANATLSELLRTKIYKKLLNIHVNKSIDTINKIYICIVLHSCIMNQNKVIFKRIVSKYKNTFSMKSLMNIVIGNTLKKDSNQTDFIKLNTIKLLHSFTSIHDYLSQLKPKTKVRLVEFLVSMNSHSKEITNLLLNNNITSYFREYVDSHRDSNFELFLKYFCHEEYELVDMFHIEVDKYFKKYLDYTVYMSNTLTLNHLEYFRKQFKLINFEEEFYVYLFQRVEDYIIYLQLEIKNMTSNEIENELLSHSTILLLIEFILTHVTKFKSLRFKTNISIFLFYIELNKQCKSKLSNIYSNKDTIVISMISFTFLHLIENVIETFIDSKEIIKFLEKYKFTGFTYWYTDIIEFSKTVGLNTVVEKLESKKKYELIFKEKGVFEVNKLKTYQIKKVYSLIEQPNQEEGVEFLNLFSIQDNSPILNEDISTSPML